MRVGQEDVPRGEVEVEDALIRDEVHGARDLKAKTHSLINIFVGIPLLRMRKIVRTKELASY